MDVAAIAADDAHDVLQADRQFRQAVMFGHRNVDVTIAFGRRWRPDKNRTRLMDLAFWISTGTNSSSRKTHLARASPIEATAAWMPLWA